MKCKDCEKYEKCRTTVDMRIYRRHCVPMTKKESEKEVEPMEFYYEGELVRTSKTRVYTHAVLGPTRNGASNRWLCYGCRSSKTGAQNLLKETQKRYKNSPKKLLGLRVVELERKEK